MNLLVKTFLILLISTIAHAESWVCYDITTKEITRTVQGDCLKLGLCSSFNNAGLQDGCFEASKEEFDKARQGNVKFDGSIVSENRVVDLTVQETEAKEKPAKDAEKALKGKIDAFKLKLKGMGFTDEEISLLLNPGFPG